MATFMHVLLATLTRAIWADGVQDPREVAAAAGIAQTLLEGALSAEELRAHFHRRAGAMPDVEYLTEEARVILFRAAIAVVAADNILDERESSFLWDLADDLALPEHIVRDLLELLAHLATGEDTSPRDPLLRLAFRLLSLPASAAVGEIKRAYRTLAIHFHPDRNSATAEMEAVANECMLWLTWAYNSALRGRPHGSPPGDHPPEILVRAVPGR